MKSIFCFLGNRTQCFPKESFPTTLIHRVQPENARLQWVRRWAGVQFKCSGKGREALSFLLDLTRTMPGWSCYQPFGHHLEPKNKSNMEDGKPRDEERSGDGVFRMPASQPRLDFSVMNQHIPTPPTPIQYFFPSLNCVEWYFLWLSTKRTIFQVVSEARNRSSALMSLLPIDIHLMINFCLFSFQDASQTNPPPGSSSPTSI